VPYSANEVLIPGVLSKHSLTSEPYPPDVQGCLTLKDKLLLLFGYFFKKSKSKKQTRCSELEILGINMKNWTRQDLFEHLSTHTNEVVYFLNAANLNQSVVDKAYRKILVENNVNLIDGVGVSIASRFTNQKVNENLNGTDLFPHLLSQAQKDSKNVYFLGSTKEVLRKMVYKLSIQYPRLNIVGYHHGHIDEKKSKHILLKLKNKEIGYLFVAMGTPMQEKWISKYKKHLNVNCIFAVGGLFDFYSGEKKRAPKLIRSLRLEWAFRLYLEPRRLFRRYIIGNVTFLVRVIFSQH
jgi:exopolysaccharide biosynthesis WecB/TagA/CpsF family protein